MRFRAGLVASLLLVTHAWGAPKLELVGAMPGMAVLRIDGAPPRTIRVGQSTPDGVKLIQVGGDNATVDVGGQRIRLVLGQGAVGGAESAGGARREVLTADGQGHFLTTITINGRSAQAVVDTGATSIAIGAGTARQLGIRYENGARMAVQTANGVVPAWRVQLDTVRLGTITLYQVDATITESEPGIVLLGMTFLSRLEMHRSNERLELIQH